MKFQRVTPALGILLIAGGLLGAGLTLDAPAVSAHDGLDVHRSAVQGSTDDGGDDHQPSTHEQMHEMMDACANAMSGMMNGMMGSENMTDMTNGMGK